MKLLFHLCAITILFICCTRCDQQQEDEQRAILTQFYYSTNGQYWLRSDNWLSTNVSSCFWFGIGCINGRAVQITLAKNHLTGTLPPTIGNLLMLETLSLEGNHLSGTVPVSIENLSRLERLWIGGNQFSGTIPAWINNLTNLFHLFLTANQFTGTIPDLSGLTRLRHVFINNNQISGTIPPTLSANTELENINLWGNQLTGTIPPELGKLKNLQNLFVARNDITGSIPDAIFDMSGLQAFGAAHNQLSGTISEKIGQLQNLTAFDIGFNQISGSIPHTIGLLRNLQRLEALENNLTGIIPESITQLTNLAQLLISGNNISGSIPENIGNLVNLQAFFASRNVINGTLPNSITNLRNLISLHIEDNQLTGTIPENIGDMISLQQIVLGRNQISGTIPASIGDLRGLLIFTGYSNRLTGPIPETMGNLQVLREINLTFNNLTGTLPPSMAEMSSLRTLAVSHNQLSGVIPQSFGSFASLLMLVLNDNNLLGTIPVALGRNQRLGLLTLDRNRFAGALPQFEADSMPANLQRFTVNNNQLTGTVPSTFALLNNLNVLDVSNNQLSGSVLHLFGLTSITELMLNNNQFVGTIPPSLTAIRLLQRLVISDNRFSGTIPEAFGQLLRLQEWRAPRNEFSGTIPATLSQLFRLQVMDLAGNNLTGTIPPQLFELPLVHLSLADNRLNGSISSRITAMQALLQLDLSSNRLSGTLPAMSGMRALRHFDVKDNLFRGCLSLPLTFTTANGFCNIERNNFCCAAEQYNCYEAFCPSKTTLHVYAGSTVSLDNFEDLQIFNNLIVEPGARLMVRDRDALTVDCMHFEGEIVFNLTGSEAESPSFFITTTCGSGVDTSSQISNEGRECHSPSIRTLGSTVTFGMVCPGKKNVALVIGLTVPLAILLIGATVLLIVIVRARKQREEKLKSRVEMLTLESHVKSNSAPPEEFKFKLPDDLPIKLSKANFKFGTKGNLLIVDDVARDVFTVSLRKSKTISVGTLYDKLVQRRTVVQIRPISSPKYDLTAMPQVFEVPEGGTTEVELRLSMKMTTKCKVSFWIELPEEEIYSLLEFDAASETSPWIDVDEVQVEGDAIGEGGFGAVYKAMYRGQRVAFKTLKMQDLGDEVAREFEQEVRMMMNLHHKAIVQFIGASRVSGKKAILTEFITNGDLNRLLRQQKLDLKLKLKIALDIAEALHFLHVNNILHRDIKPENVLVVSTSKDAIVNVKLADFGTARSVSDSITSKFTKGVGTPIYMAVEILKNETYARSADIFSFAVLLWAIVTQDEPYKDFKFSWDVADFILQGKRLPLPEECPTTVRELISQCWAQDPADRPTIAQIVNTLETVYASIK